MPIEFLGLQTSETKGKKYDALFLVNDKPKKVSFGAAGMSDFTIHKDEDRKERYMARHRTTEHWNDPLTPGALSRWILWNKPSLRGSLADYKRRFGF